MSEKQRFGTIEARAAVHAALGEPHRLAIVDALVLSDRSPSELLELTAIESNLLTHHLDVLERAGVIQRVASGGDRRRRYLRLVHEALPRSAQTQLRVVRSVLFVCTENSARSQMAAAIWNASMSGHAQSAGTQPAKRVHPLAISTAARHGLDLSHARPRRLSEIRKRPEVIVTVCDRAHEEFSERVRSDALHWSIPDPAVTGTVAAFTRAYRALEQRIEATGHLLTQA